MPPQGVGFAPAARSSVTFANTSHAASSSGVARACSDAPTRVSVAGDAPAIGSDAVATTNAVGGPSRSDGGALTSRYRAATVPKTRYIPKFETTENGEQEVGGVAYGVANPCYKTRVINTATDVARSGGVLVRDFTRYCLKRYNAWRMLSARVALTLQCASRASGEANNLALAWPYRSAPYANAASSLLRSVCSLYERFL